MVAGKTWLVFKGGNFHTNITIEQSVNRYQQIFYQILLEWFFKLGASYRLHALWQQNQCMRICKCNYIQSRKWINHNNFTTKWSHKMWSNGPIRSYDIYSRFGILSYKVIAKWHPVLVHKVDDNNTCTADSLVWFSIQCCFHYICFSWW